MDVRLVDVEIEQLVGIKLKLLTLEGELDPISAGYALQRYDSRRKPNSIKRDMQSIQHLYRFCLKQNIDLFGRISTQTPLSMGEIESLSAFCAARVDTGEIVGEGTYQQRLGLIWSYITWLWAFYQNRSKQKLDELKAAKIQFDAMKAGFDLYRSAPYRVDRADRVGLDPDLQKRFVEIINPLPDNTLNPWKQDRIRWRNYALLLTMILGGNRKGETLLLKINQFALTGKRKYFEIIKTPDVPYPRSEAPSVKTLGRQVELSDVLASIFEHYITTWRKQFAGADKSRYMFLSGRDGLPLSTHTPNAILQPVIDKHPQFRGKLSPHRLRNTFHDLLNEALNKKFSTEAPLSRDLQKKPLQEYAGGWVKGSKMTTRYPKGSIQREVAVMHHEIQAHQLPDSE